ncbi:MAG: hypothetical protein RJA63_11 [Pseudomonadota bacterium]|jgi:hypothetical protein
MSKTARQADVGFDSEDPRCNDGGPACEGCLMVGWCLGDYPLAETVSAERVSAADELVTAGPDGCGRCHTCAPNKIGGPIRMIVCLECGNKRCPKASDCRNDCTGSNEPGQAGSAYPAATTITERQCCGSLVTGPHKMGCNYKLVATESTNEINGLQQKQAVSGSSGGRPCKPCRCGQDGCADSVACPRR